jgi:alpha-L-fucosidase
MAAWMDVNSEAIFSTRPWTVYGEGPSTVEAPDKGKFGGSRDVRKAPYTAQDIRFTKKGDTVYAILLAWPADRAAVVKSMANQAAAMNGAGVADVTLLGCDQALKWTRDADGLHVELPAQAPCDHAYVLKVRLNAS